MEFRIPVQDRVSVRTSVQEGFTQLLVDPFGGRMPCHVEVEDPATSVFDHEETVQQSGSPDTTSGTSGETSHSNSRDFSSAATATVARDASTQARRSKSTSSRYKAKVESGVLLTELWIIAALRHRKFFSIEELNLAIRELRDRINQRPFRKREGSRASQFATLDKPALNPLPVERFDLSQWCRARVNTGEGVAV